MSLAAGATAYEAAIIANYAAGVEVGKLGAATVSPEEIVEAAPMGYRRVTRLDSHTSVFVSHSSFVIRHSVADIY